MEKIIPKEVTSVLNIHHFYCDMCEKHLGSTREYDDGYYGTTGDYDLEFNINGEWYKLHRNLCVECRAKLRKDIIDTLLSKGFVKE